MTTTLAPAPPAPPAEKATLAPGGGLRRRIALRLLALVVLYILWDVTARVMRNPAFIPSPGAVWDQLITTSTEGYSGHSLLEHLGVSLRRIVIGSAVGIAGGLLIGVLLGTVGWLRASGGGDPEEKSIRLAYQAFPSGDLIVKNQGLLKKNGKA
ncbi:MAG TPA: hypothetical protein VN408_19140 [Actinoplanes sp.]|nr:hypothetical protein [Actinoplanes sp.]